MSKPNAPIVVIPARMASTRLPDKPLADIAGAPMIVQVWRRAMEADCGPVIVACGEPEIADAITAAGGDAVLTDPNHPSGSDRIHEAVERYDPDGQYDGVINLQGDLPTLAPEVTRAVLEPLADSDVDIATLVTRITDTDERTNPNVVKAVLTMAPDQTSGRALYFSRATVPWSDDDAPLYHHIGIYAYRRAALRRFVGLPPGVLEQRERLEQLRALENGMVIAAACVDTVPLGVDTPADLERARRILAET
ncbi:MAG: 3-deoxy-manno-octulosonate cytidylyltransferase [Rhodospirillaceae bacterium]|jgi:3-deoxy-manno-octulosonate cytidylyltransferase (CMP-KDO synthetase)|nr:3-deoxy-manno-octulosonate cytidylyltransferase [Rhodospirillaceae bacterium]